MNWQKPGQIGWTEVWGRRGATWNPLSGCLHDCEWEADGKIISCYAKAFALRTQMYSNGFAPEWHATKVTEPLRVKEPAGIFVGSMADIFGSWVAPWHLNEILKTCRQAHWHIFLALTKNPGRLRDIDLPPNVWIGVSMPPDRLHGKTLTQDQKVRYMARAMTNLAVLKEAGATTFMSFEPLSFDVAPLVYSEALSWAIIGALSAGPQKFQPEKAHVEELLTALDGVPIYMKENLIWNPIRREFPAQEIA